MGSKSSQTDVERLRATIAKLEAKLEKAERRTMKWKTEAKAGRTTIAKLEAALRRARGERPRDHGIDSGDVPVDPQRRSTGEPDDSWTVVQLRTAARAAGVERTSGMTRAQLLASLRP